jgi:hypothetical protein
MNVTEQNILHLEAHSNPELWKHKFSAAEFSCGQDSQHAEAALQVALVQMSSRLPVSVNRYGCEWRTLDHELPLDATRSRSLNSEAFWKVLAKDLGCFPN